MSNKIILLQDLLDSKERKEQELKFYRERLETLIQRVSLLQND